jgi:hypothetical protein
MEQQCNPMITIKAIRTSAFTAVETEVSIDCEVRKGHDGKDWIYIVNGGITGYESMPLDELDKAISSDGWLANFGTRRRWDSMLVPSHELMFLKEALERSQQ